MPAFDYVGIHRYFVTICTRARIPVFVTHVRVDCVTSQLLQSAASAEFAIVAYCFMPDHLHLLIEGLTPHANFLEFMRVFKQRTSFHWKQRFGGPLWQRSYYEHVLREDENAIDVARYVVANPVRAGIVADPAQYPFLGSQLLDVHDLLESVRRMGRNDQKSGPT